MTYVSGGNELLDAWKILRRLGIKAGSKVADLGCGGAGHFIIPAAQLAGQDSTVYAVDILKSALNTVSTKASAEGIYNIKPIWSNIEIVGATNIKDNSLDFVLLVNNFFQTKEYGNQIKEAIRLLRRNGRVLIVDWNDTPTAFGPAVIDRVSETEVEHTAENLGLKLIENFQAGTYHYGFIFEKL